MTTKPDRGGRPPRKWWETARTQTWLEAVRRKSGGLSDADLDLAVVEGTPWEGRARVDRMQFFARANKRLPSRGRHSVGQGIDVVALAERKWPGSENIFEHPIWRCWAEPPTTFTKLVNDVDITLDAMGLHRDRDAVNHGSALWVSADMYPKELERFQQSLEKCLPALQELDRLWLVTTMFREADCFRLRTFPGLMHQLRELIFEFRMQGLGKNQNDVVIESALLYRRGHVELDDVNTILCDDELLAPIAVGRIHRELWTVHPKNVRRGGWP